MFISFLFFFFHSPPPIFYSMNTNGHREKNTSGGRRSFGWVVNFPNLLLRTAHDKHTPTRAHPKTAQTTTTTTKTQRPPATTDHHRSRPPRPSPPPPARPARPPVGGLASRRDAQRRPRLPDAGFTVWQLATGGCRPILRLHGTVVAHHGRHRHRRVGLGLDRIARGISEVVIPAEQVGPMNRNRRPVTWWRARIRWWRSH